MPETKSLRVGLIIPVLNAGPHLGSLIPAIQAQTLRPDRFLVVDSDSDDDGPARFRAAGAEVIAIERGAFDHGGTRQMAAERLTDCDILLYLTQDAYPATSDCFARLTATFADPSVAVAYGRQLPHPHATPISEHARSFNYPSVSHMVCFEQRREVGIRSFFCSNSFAAYRSTALQQVGGFPRRTIFGEDSLVTATLLKEGWRKCYVAEAAVYHSHNYSPAEDFRRAFDIGVFHASEPWLLETFATAGGEGRRFVMSELQFLLVHSPLAVFSAVVRTALKALGYGLGRRNRILPRSWIRRFSLNRQFWRNPDFA